MRLTHSYVWVLGSKTLREILIIVAKWDYKKRTHGSGLVFRFRISVRARVRVK